MTVFVLGRFPPPVDGQTLATERLATMIENDVQVHRVNTESSHDEDAGAAAHPLYRAAHFLRLRSELRSQLAVDPAGTVLWPAVSPDPPGHFRDLLITLRAVHRSRRVFAIVHRGNFRRLFESPATTATARLLVRRTRGFVFLTHQLSEQCSRWIPEHKRLVIPNTIDEDLLFSDFEVAEKRERRRGRTVLSLLFVGHMLPSKGYLDVLEAVHLVHQLKTPIEAHFVGRWNNDGDREDFAARVESRGLQNVVIHHGPVTRRSAMKELHREADVLLLPSYYRNEAQPLVILEALNAGTPVISTTHAGIPEMIGHEKEGLLVPPRDPKSLAAAVQGLSDVDYWHRVSQNARRRFLDAYSPDVVRQKWLTLLHA